ncbi:MAG TPA: hypothetical protein VFT87_06005 [Candidatus Saccharimonadales bacterium]|nr:hypothetical protein [Candidatus Saccharimonadales bacterium]
MFSQNSSPRLPVRIIASMAEGKDEVRVDNSLFITGGERAGDPDRVYWEGTCLVGAAVVRATVGRLATASATITYRGITYDLNRKSGQVTFKDQTLYLHCWPRGVNYDPRTNRILDAPSS